MKIFTAVMGHWDVPGLITKSFTSAAKAEDWMLKIYGEQLRDYVSLANSYRAEEGEPYLDENPETLVDLEDLIETLNGERDWAGVAELIESELDDLTPTPEMREAAKVAGEELCKPELGAMRKAFGEIAEAGLVAGLEARVSS